MSTSTEAFIQTAETAAALHGDSLAVFGPDRRLCHVNRRWAEYQGYTDAKIGVSTPEMLMRRALSLGLYTDPLATRDPERFIHQQVAELDLQFHIQTRATPAGWMSTLTHFRLPDGTIVQRRTVSTDPWIAAKDTVVGISENWLIPLATVFPVSGLLIKANAAFERMLSMSADLRLSDGHLTSPTDPRSLGRALRGDRPQRTEFVGGDEFRAAIILRAKQLSDRSLLLAAVVPGAPSVDPETLSDLYGLTKAEARFAVAVGTGDTIKEAARRVRLSEGRARNLLSAVYAKTGCAGHAGLARLLAQLAPLDTAPVSGSHPTSTQSKGAEPPCTSPIHKKPWPPPRAST